MDRNEKIARLIAQNTYRIEDLMEIVELLRGEGGCPWDREQTHESIRNDLIEETYEVIEAIDTGSTSLLREELGDLLFQILFHAQIEREKGSFELEEIITEISAKMIHRHPHVFGDVTVKNTGEVLSNWESIKTEEKQRNTLADKLRAIPPMLPALMRAQKVAKKSGEFANLTREELLDRLQEGVDALRKDGGSTEALGQMLLVTSAFAQISGVSAEQALFEQTNVFIEQLSDKNV